MKKANKQRKKSLLKKIKNMEIESLIATSLFLLFFLARIVLERTT